MFVDATMSTARMHAHKVALNRIIHGGADVLGPKGAEAAEVYVLSLPAFRWFRSNFTDSPRIEHICCATKTNQMIMIGGINPLYSAETYIGDGSSYGEPQDPWANGVAVFDMTALRFKDSYQAGAGPYEPPNAVQRHYSGRYVFPSSLACSYSSYMLRTLSGRKYPSSWTSPQVQALFEKSPSQTTLQTTDPTTVTKPPEPTNPTNSTSSTSTTRPKKPTSLTSNTSTVSTLRKSNARSFFIRYANQKSGCSAT